MLFTEGDSIFFLDLCHFGARGQVRVAEGNAACCNMKLTPTPPSPPTPPTHPTPTPTPTLPPQQTNPTNPTMYLSPLSRLMSTFLFLIVFFGIWDMWLAVFVRSIYYTRITCVNLKCGNKKLHFFTNPPVYIWSSGNQMKLSNCISSPRYTQFMDW